MAVNTPNNLKLFLNSGVVLYIYVTLKFSSVIIYSIRMHSFLKK